MVQSLPAGTGFRERTDLDVELADVGGDAAQRLGHGAEQDGIDDRFVVERDVGGGARCNTSCGRCARSGVVAQLDVTAERRGVTEFDRAHDATLRRNLPIYIKALSEDTAAPPVKQQLAAIRMLCNWLMTGEAMANNPAAAVRGGSTR